MTARSLGYALLLVLLYLTINYSGNDFLMVFFFFLCLLPVVSLLAAIMARHFLQVRLEVADGQVMRGQDVKIYIHVYNPTFLPLPLISLALSHQDRSSFRGQRLLRLRLGSREQERFTVFYRFTHRGLYHIKIEEGRLRDSCGFFTLFLAKHAISKGVVLEIWPRQVALASGNATNVAEIEEEISRSTKTSQELDEIAKLRDYQPGDKLKLVHWSVSARMQVLQVREFEEPRDLETAIILADALPGGPSGRHLADAGAEVALGLTIQTVAQKMPTRLILAGMAGLSEAGSVLIRELGEINLASSSLAQQLPEQLVRESDIQEGERIVLSPVTNPELEDMLMQQLPSATKIVYLVVYALDERLIAILRQLMKQLAKLYLIVLTVDDGIDFTAYHEALSKLNVQIIDMDAKQFMLPDESEAEANEINE